MATRLVPSWISHPDCKKHPFCNSALHLRFHLIFSGQCLLSSTDCLVLRQMLLNSRKEWLHHCLESWRETASAFVCVYYVPEVVDIKLTGGGMSVCPWLMVCVFASRPLLEDEGMSSGNIKQVGLAGWPPWVWIPRANFKMRLDFWMR